MIERIQYLKEFIQIMVAHDPKLKRISLDNFNWQQVKILAKTLEKDLTLIILKILN